MQGQVSKDVEEWRKGWWRVIFEGPTVRTQPVMSMNREVMNRSGHQHGRGEAILGVWLALFPEKYIYIYTHVRSSPTSPPRWLSFSFSGKTTIHLLSYSCRVGEIEYIRSIPIHIKASEIHPLIQAYVGIHVGTRNWPSIYICIHVLGILLVSLYLFLLPIPGYLLPVRYRTPSCQNHDQAKLRFHRCELKRSIEESKFSL